MVKIKEVSEDLSQGTGLFWGVAMQGGKRYSQKVVTPFHISMAALEPGSAGTEDVGNGYVTVWLGVKGFDYLLCTLKHDSILNVALDYELDIGEELDLFINGKGTVYLTGHLRVENDPPEDWTDYDEDGEGMDASLGSEEEDDEDDIEVMTFGDSEEDSEEEDDEEMVPIQMKRKAKKPKVPEEPSKKAKKDATGPQDKKIKKLAQDDAKGKKKEAAKEKVEVVEVVETSNAKKKKKKNKKTKNPNAPVVENGVPAEAKDAAKISESAPALVKVEDPTKESVSAEAVTTGPDAATSAATAAEPAVTISAEAVAATAAATASSVEAKPVAETVAATASSVEVAPVAEKVDAPKEPVLEKAEAETSMDVDAVVDEGLKTIRQEVEVTKDQVTSTPVESSPSAEVATEIAPKDDAASTQASPEVVAESSAPAAGTEDPPAADLNATNDESTVTLNESTASLNTSDGAASSSKKKKKKNKNKDKSMNQSANGGTPESKDVNGNVGEDGKKENGVVDKKPPTPNKKAEEAGAKTLKLPGGLVIHELNDGGGALAKKGAVCLVKYTGRLKSNNKVFDSNTGPHLQPLKVVVGKKDVIEGFDEGLEGMKVGGKRRLVIPPNKAYGRQSPSKDIPPNSALIFDVELVKILGKKGSK